MTHRQQVLELIRRSPGLTDTELARLVGLTPHRRMSTICRDLAERGLTERRRGPGGRLVNLPLSAAHPTD